MAADNPTRTLPGVGAAYPQYNLARLITRLLSRETYLKPDQALPLSWFENVWGYFEVNPVATIPMNRTVICTAMFAFFYWNRLTFSI